MDRLLVLCYEVARPARGSGPAAGAWLAACDRSVVLSCVLSCFRACVCVHDSRVSWPTLGLPGAPLNAPPLNGADGSNTRPPFSLPDFRPPGRKLNGGRKHNVGSIIRMGVDGDRPSSSSRRPGIRTTRCSTPSAQADRFGCKISDVAVTADAIESLVVQAHGQERQAAHSGGSPAWARQAVGRSSRRRSR